MDVKKARTDIIIYSAFTILGVIFYKWVIPTQIFISKTASAEAFSPDTFPNAVTILFILASAVGLLLAIARYRKAIAQAKVSPELEPKATKKTKTEIIGILVPFIVFALVVLYAVLFMIIGFIPATIIVPPIILLAIGCKKWNYYVIYYVFAGLMYLLFRYILLVPIR